MTANPLKNDEEEPVPREAEPAPLRRWRTLPEQGWWIVGAVALVSLLIHVGTGYELSHLRDLSDPWLRGRQPPPVKIRIVEKPKPKPPKKNPEEEPEKPEDPEIPAKILETKQTETEKPDEASYVGHTNHKAEKETRIDEMIKRERAADAGVKGNPNATKEPTPEPPQKTKPRPPQPPQPVVKSDPKPKPKPGVGKLSFDALKPEPRNAYEAMLPSSVNDLPGQLDAGYQDFVDDKIARGDRIDINTTEYRYIGYFTNMRKAIELVWNYPAEASRKGMQGEVGLEFAINKDGTANRIKVIRSSGYKILDRAIVDAIRLASPFSPLPDGFGRERIVVTGSFRYIISGLGGH